MGAHQENFVLLLLLLLSFFSPELKCIAMHEILVYSRARERAGRRVMVNAPLCLCMCLYSSPGLAFDWRDVPFDRQVGQSTKSAPLFQSSDFLCFVVGSTGSAPLSVGL